MSRKGENIFKRNDRRWERRYIKAHVGSKTVYGCVYGKLHKDVKEKKLVAINRLSEHSSEAKPLKEIPTVEVTCFLWLESLKPVRKDSTIVKYQIPMTMTI